MQTLAHQTYAVVAQSVERFLGKEEVRQFKSAQQLQAKRTVEIPTVLFRCRDMRDRFPESQKIRKGRGLTMNKIKMNDLADTQVKEVFENFVIAAKRKGFQMLLSRNTTDT